MTEHSDIRASATSDVMPENVAISCGTESVEKRKLSDLKDEVECDHLEAGVIPNTEGKLSVIEFTYCPKCGVKL